MRRVTWPLTGGKNSPHFWNPWPQFAYSLRHFQGATTKIKPCYRQKIAFSHYEGYKVYCACAVSRGLFHWLAPSPLKHSRTTVWVCDIQCFCATISHDLVTLTFDLLTLIVCHVQCFSCLTHLPIFIILWLSVTELRVLNIWSHFPYLKQSLSMRRVTWPVHRGSPKTTRNNFLTPNCLFTIQLLCGYDDD